MLNPFRNKVDVKQYTDCYETIRVLLQHHKPKYLCDIGASDGTWTYTLSVLNSALRHAVCFEPRSDAFALLQDRHFPGVEKRCYPFGLGNNRSKKYLKGGTNSASFFDEKEQQKIFPASLNKQKEKVDVYKLDEIYKKNRLPYPDTIKIDVQGYEQYVLEGAKSVLSRAKFLIIELSFREFYEGQPPLSRTLRFLEKHNYEMVDFGFEWRSNKGELVQIDGILRNKK